MNLGPKQTVLRALVNVRFQDGEALLKTGQPARRNGAVYVAGYGVECALKARICADRSEDRLDSSFFHHDLRRLAEATAKWPAISVDSHWLSRLTWLQSEWHVSMRYETRTYDPQAVVRFIARAKEFKKWLLED